MNVVNTISDSISEGLSTFVNSIVGVFSSTGYSISQGLSQLANALPDSTIQSLNNTNQIINNAKIETAKVMNSSSGDVVTKAVVSVGVVSGATISVASALFINPLTFPELFLIPVRLWALLMAALGLKKRNKPWGTVYDSVTKQPLDPAYVILQDLDGKEVATSITDIDGRYGFLVPAGQYRLLAHKSNYEFPSAKLAEKDVDEIYTDLYTSGIIEISSDGAVITKNIPMDPVNFNWNEFEKKQQPLMKFYSKRNLWINKISNFMFNFGFIVTMVAVTAAPKTYNIITLIVYLVLYLIRLTLLKPRPFGVVREKGTGNPLPFAVVRVYSIDMQREIGKFYCLIPNGIYSIRIDKKNADESYSQIYSSDYVEVKDGFINKYFEV